MKKDPISLTRFSKVEEQVRTLTKTMTDYNTRITRLERRARILE